MMKTLKVTMLAGMLTALLAAPAMASTTLLSDAYGTATATKGFALDTGVNIGINPPDTNRMTGSIAKYLRYHQSNTNRSATKFGIASGRLRVETENQIGRFTLVPYDQVTAFDFGPALGIPNASPATPVSYDVKVSMRNDANGSPRFSFAFGTVESDANNWDFGVQLYRASTNHNYYTIQKRIDSASSGIADMNAVMATTDPDTHGSMVNFLIRVTDAGAETSSYNSRVQVSIDNGATWIYDTSDDSALVNGFRFDAAGRYITFDQAPNSGANGGNVFYDNVSVTWTSGPRAWDGGGSDGNWSDPINWGGATPVDGSILIFSGAIGQSNTNDISNLAVPSITLSNGGFQIYGNSLTVTDGITHLDGDNVINSSITLAGEATLQSSAGTLTLGNIAGDGQNLTVTGAGNVIVAGAITTSGGALTKQDAGTLTLEGENAYTGATTISAGTLALTGSGAIGSSSSIVISSGATLDATARVDGTLHLNSGQTLTGDGPVNGSASISGTLSPGSSVGSFTTGSQTWNSGGQLNWEVSAVAGTAGVEWDSLVVNGTLDVAASRSTPFVINISGAATGFDNGVEQSWDVVTTTDGILNFDPARINVVAPGFDVGANGGFGVRVSGNVLQVFFGQKPVVQINNAAKVAAFGDLNLSIGGDGNDFTVTAGAPILGYQWKKDGVILSDDANTSGAATTTLTLAKVFGANGGNYSITVWNAAGSTTSGDIALSVTKANQHIVATAAPEQNYGDSVNLGSFFVSKDASETPTGVTLNYSLDSGASIASIDDGVLTFNGVGTVTVRAAAPETLDYNAGTDVTGDITAGTRTLTIVPDATSRAYGDTNPIFTVSFTGLALGETVATSDITGADSVTASSTADVTTTLGDQTITVDGASLAGLSSSHYDFTTATGTLTITNRALTIVAASASKTFGDTDPVLTWTTNGFVNGDENLDLGEGLTVLSGTPVVSRVAGENAGTYAITVDTNGVTVNTNLYVLQSTEGVFTIDKATPTVNVTSLPSETYNGASHPTTASVTGVGGADLGAATISYTPGGASAPVDAGDYGVEGNFAGNENYNAATGFGSIHIGQATVDPVVTIDNKSYDGTTGGSILSRNLTGVFGADDVSLTGGTATFADAVVGLGKSVSVTDLSLSGTGSGNYQLSSTSVAVSANITPATVDPEITAEDKSYDGTTSAAIATRSLNGVFGSDDVTLTGGTATFDTATAGTGKTVTAVDLALSGADIGNYQLSTTTATTTANITGISVTPHITAEDKVYDGTADATIVSRSLTGVIGDDEVILNGGTATFANATAGDGKTVTEVGLSLSGADSENYQLVSTSAQTMADISPATPVITWGPLDPIVTGTTLAATLNASADVEGSFAYFDGVTAVDESTLLPIGTYTLTAQFTPSDSVNYLTATLGRILSVTDVPDVTTPLLKLVGPKSSGVYTTSSLLLTGTVYDAVGPIVEYTLNANPVETANLHGVVGLKKASNYTATLFPTPGTNTLVVTGKDLAGNTTNIAIKFFYHTPSMLVIQTNLNGNVITTNGVGAVLNTISAALYSGNNTNLFVGRTYTLKALETGAPKYILTNWTATWTGQASPVVLQTNSLACTFEMKEGMVLSANYIDNPFYRFGGVYNGLFSATPVAFESAGFVTVKVTPKMTYSAKLIVDGNPISISGKLKIDGTATGISKARFKTDKPELTLNLAMDFAGGTDSLSGTVVQPTGSTNWTANLLAYRSPWTTNEVDLPLTFTNNYTMLIPGFDTLAEGPSGTGSGAFKIDLKGKAILAGVAADMQPLKQAVLISGEGHWPFFAPMYKSKRTNELLKPVTETEGFVMGWLQITNDGATGPMSPVGELHWIKSGWTNSTYAAGFTNDAKSVTGAVWSFDPLAPANTLPGMTQVQIDLLDGDLTSPFNAIWDVTVKSTFAAVKTNTYPNFVKAALTTKTGLVKGQFAHPLTPAVEGKVAPTKFQGVMLQPTQTGAGTFVGPSNGGKVTIAAPTP